MKLFNSFNQVENKTHRSSLHLHSAYQCWSLCNVVFSVYTLRSILCMCICLETLLQYYVAAQHPVHVCIHTYACMCVCNWFFDGLACCPARMSELGLTLTLRLLSGPWNNIVAVTGTKTWQLCLICCLLPQQCRSSLYAVHRTSRVISRQKQLSHTLIQDPHHHQPLQCVLNTPRTRIQNAKILLYAQTFESFLHNI
jgi:hypothetical protein